MKLAQAIRILRPTAVFGLTDASDLATLKWDSLDVSRPTDAEILAMAERDVFAPLSPAQAHHGLADRHLLEPFYAWLGGLPLPTRKAFEFADNHPRESSTLAAGLSHPAVAGYGVEQLDAFWRQYGG